MSAHPISVKIYFGVFLTLIALTLLTVKVAFIDLGSLNILVALAIALTKASLVVLYFMHVRYGSRLIWLFVAAGCLWIAIMIGLTFGDYMTRAWIEVPQAW
ncbi:MAG: cytochrome C oxidase subunit IV family protein [Chlamydiota bacterium]|nr:cytochrome C oxidase subunit IV family protein [Chlamydiota bacterium]